MDVIIDFFAAVFGLCVGSFANVVIDRTRKEKSLGGFSACPRCGRRLRPLDLIPVASFFMLGGKCRYCKKSISWQYPLVELAMSGIFLLIARFSVSSGGSGFFSSRPSWLLFQFFLAACLLIIFVFDLRYYLIPDAFVVFGFFGAVFYRFFFSLSFAEGFLGMLAVAGFFGLLYLMSSGKWIGLGDVKLGVFLGFLLGLKLSVLMLMLAYVGGALVGVILVLAKRRKLSGTLPFGTFLTAATLAAMLWGEGIAAWYLNLFY